MNKRFAFVSAIFFAFAAATASFAFDEFNVWPDVAPGEAADAKKPTFEYWKPANQTSDACLIVCPGGGYLSLAYEHEGKKIAEYFNGKGVAVVVLKYRVPYRKDRPKYLSAWQDAQRTVRIVRSRAAEWGIDPNKIGVMGFSAGGHLALLVATSSRTPSYEPIDELDEIPCNVNFAVPVYPAYVLDFRPDGPKMAPEFAFDDQTPPTCFVHGDADHCSPLASTAVYAKLRKMNIPAELHIYAKIEHGFGGNPTDNHVGDWLNRVYAWTKAAGF